MRLWGTLCLLFLCAVDAHIRLVYPPARQPSLDFYSTLNSHPPCGVPKPPSGKGVTTYLQAGSDVEIEWFTAIPHMGGVRVEVLNALDQPIAIFTNFLDPYNISTARKTISLPAKFECNNCAIRLTHQATEYGPEYQFFTCADVNIVNAIPDGDSCLGRGERVDGECICSNQFMGSNCEHEVECIINQDCGQHGTCKMTSDQPSQQCYCEKGHYGKNCQKDSLTHSSPTQFDPSIYQFREVADNKIYWRIIEDEIEFVLKFPGYSWVGIGWKPSDYVCPTVIPQPQLYEQKKVSFPRKQTTTEAVTKASVEEKNLKKVEIGKKNEEPTKTTTTTVVPESKKKEMLIESEESEEIFTTSTSRSTSAVSKSTSATSTSTANTSKSTTERTTKASTKNHIDEENTDDESTEDGELPFEADLDSEFTSTTTKKSTVKSTTTKTTTTTEAPTTEESTQKEESAEKKENKGSETSTDDNGCRSNEIYTQCPEMSRECEASCDWTRFPETIPNCPRTCGEPRCICKEGFVRQANDDNTCVPFDFCSAEEEPQCPHNSTWAKCGIACEPSCENMYDTSPCPSSCEKPACTCADNYVRFKGKCVYWGDCPNLDEHLAFDESHKSVATSDAVSADLTMKTSTTTIVPKKNKEVKTAEKVRPGLCPVNETMTECGAVCEADCVTIFSREACDQCGDPSCACLQGYARLNDVCVYWGDCTADAQKKQATSHLPKLTLQRPVEKIVEEKPKASNGEQCYGDWRYPAGCKDCDYKLAWNYVDETDEIEFSLETKAPQNWWTGVGFSAGGSMVDADMIIIKSENGKLTLHDMYSSSYGVPALDVSQDVYTPSIVGSHVNGVLRAQFTRKRNTGDKKGDHAFSDSTCYNFLFPVEGGRLDDNGNITIHLSTPIVSDDKVCVRSCIQAEPEKTTSDAVCESEFRHPASCVDTACDYIAKWSYDEDKKDIKFEISSKELGRWTGIGFSKDGQMTNADIYTGWVYEGKAYVTDRFAYGRQLPAIDPADRSDIYDIQGKQQDEMQTISFRRPVVPKDTITDYPLDQCYYFLFPIGGGRVLARKSSDFTNPRTPIGYHDLFQPRVSKTKFCVCDGQGKKLKAEPTQVRMRRQATQLNNAEASAMACTDMVVGTVQDGFGRVRDMYSPSKATPRMDAFFAGTDDLTGASAYQEDGVTTIVFRKKLQSSDPADHSIVRGPMTLIWAKGADPNRYQHTTGGSTIRADPAFFSRDAFKYHGKNHRGVLTVDFFETSSVEKTSETEDAEPEIVTKLNTHVVSTPESRMPPIPDAPRRIEETAMASCSGIFTYPKGCSVPNCKYAVGWTSDGAKISFHLEAAMTDSRWTAVGFSQDGGMANSDVIIVSYIEGEGSDEITVTDQFMPNYGRPSIDEQQDIFDVSSNYIDGKVFANFSRTLKTDDANDLSLTECVYFLFTPTGGFLEHNGDIRKHGDTPISSQTKICLTSCGTASEERGNAATEASEDQTPESVSRPVIPAVKPADVPEDVSKAYTDAPTTERPRSTIPGKSRSSTSAEDVRMPPIIKAGPPLVSYSADARKRYGLRVRILNKEFVSPLMDPHSEYYKSFTKDVTSAINNLLATKWKGMRVSKIVEYTKGSVIAEFEVDSIESEPKPAEIQSLFEDAALRGALPGFSVEPSTVKVKEVEIPQEPMDDTSLFGLQLNNAVIRNLLIIGIAVAILVFAICCACCMLCRVRRSNQFSPMHSESMEAKSYSDIPYKADSYPSYPAAYPAAYGPYGTLNAKKTPAGFENKAFQGQPPGSAGTHQRHFSQATTASNKGGSNSPAPSNNEPMPDGMGETTYQEWYSKVASKPAAQTHEETLQPPARPPSSQPYVSYPNDPSAYYTLGGEHRTNRQQPGHFRPPY